MAIKIDPRTTVFGDRMVVTGSYAAADADIDLSAFLSEITGVILSATGTAGVPPENYAINGTTIKFTAVNKGVFTAIGKRS